MKITKEFIKDNIINIKGGIISVKAKKIGATPQELYNIYYSLEKDPKCECGNVVSFINFKNGYRTFCSRKCINTSEVTKLKIKNTHLEKYGKKYNNREKAKSTCIERYGVDNVSLAPKIIAKIKSTKEERYGSPGYNNTKKRKETCIEKYGVEFASQHKKVRDKISKSSKNGDIEVIAKKKKTCLENYGYTCGFNIPNKKYLEKRGQATAKGLKRFYQNNNIPHRFLYIIQTKKEGLVKIGITTNPKKRLSEIKKSFSDCEIIFVDYFNSSNEYETHLQTKYDTFCRVQEKHIQGKTEWFSDDIVESLLDDIYILTDFLVVLSK